MPSLLVPIFPLAICRETAFDVCPGWDNSYVTFSLPFPTELPVVLPYSSEVQGFFTPLSLGTTSLQSAFPYWAPHRFHTSRVHLVLFTQQTLEDQLCHTKRPARLIIPSLDVSFLVVLWSFWWCRHYRERQDRGRGGLLSKLEWTKVENAQQHKCLWVKTRRRWHWCQLSSWPHVSTIT